MAKVIITIEDTKDGVKVLSDPEFTEILEMNGRGEATSCHNYACRALTAILKANKKKYKMPKSLLGKMFKRW